MDKKLPVLGRADPLERLLAGDSAGVIADLKERLEKDPDDAVAWLQLGAAYTHIEHPREAIDALARAVELEPAVLEARRLYARALGRVRRHDEAVFQLVQARRLAPDDARVAHELGVAFYDKKLYAKALAELARAATLAPDDARVRYALGLAHEGAGAMADAIAAYRDAVRLDPSFIAARRTLADALAAMGEMAGAKSELEAALAADRSNTEVAQNLEVLERGLRDLAASRLVGKGRDDLERSALATLGHLRKQSDVCYASGRCELRVAFDAGSRITSLHLAFVDPERAARMPDDTFQVTVLGTDGQVIPTNFATAATLTFLREALGCPLTAASRLYAALLGGDPAVAWQGIRLAFADVDGRHGLLVTSS
jgi:Flp pilus assembly protein TadD